MDQDSTDRIRRFYHREDACRMYRIPSQPSRQLLSHKLIDFRVIDGMITG